MKKNIRNIIICLSILTVSLIGIGSYMITAKLINTSTSHTQVDNNHNNEVKINCAAARNDISKNSNTRLEVAASIHLMANGLIVAEDNAKDGVKSITQDELKGRAVSINQPAIKPTINLIKRGDFSKDEK